MRHLSRANTKNSHDLSVHDLSVAKLMCTRLLRPLHARSLCKVHAMFKTDRGKQIILNGWRAAGIVDAVKDARTTVTDILDPFAELTL